MSDDINLICENCLSPQLRVETFPNGAGKLICNDCDYSSLLAKEEVRDVLERAGWFKSFEAKSQMQATICYDSIESASGPMTLGMLYDAVTEAIEKGMPTDSEVFESSSQEAISGVRFLFETEKVEPIMCGDHIGSDPQDLIVTTHYCEHTDD